MNAANDTAALDLRESLKLSLDLLGAMERASLSAIREHTLADQIAYLINSHEPALRAEADGASVTVREIGNGTSLRITVSADANR